MLKKKRLTELSNWIIDKTRIDGTIIVACIDQECAGASYVGF